MARLQSLIERRYAKEAQAPGDPIQLAKLVGDIRTGQSNDESGDQSNTKPGKNKSWDENGSSSDRGSRRRSAS